MRRRTLDRRLCAAAAAALADARAHPAAGRRWVGPGRAIAEMKCGWGRLAAGRRWVGPGRAIAGMKCGWGRLAAGRMGGGWRRGGRDCGCMWACG